MAMNSVRFNQLYSGQTTIAQKVYGCVPIESAWSVPQIASEASRAGIHVDYRVLHGCLAALTRAGLIDEPKRNEYKRVPVRGRIAHIEAPDKDAKPLNPVITPEVSTKIEEAPAATPVVEAQKPTEEPNMSTLHLPQQPLKRSALDRLAEIGQHLARVSLELKEVSEEFANIAVELQEEIDENENKLEQVRKLAKIFQSLGN